MHLPRAHLIVNKGSGQGLGETLPDLAREICRELNFELILHAVVNPHDLADVAEKAIAQAELQNEIVMVAGGDGTIRSVAEKAAGKQIKFAVLPCGTFNFFARTHQIPEDLTEAMRLALTGGIKKVRLGSMNEHVFLVNASLGIYAKSIINRETHTARFGRNRAVVILSTLHTFFSQHKILEVTFCSEKQEKKFRTPMIFIGNNSLQLRNLSIPVAQCLGEDLLALVIMKPLLKWDITRIMVRGLFKLWEKEDRLQSFCVENLTIRSKKGTHLVALDGEVFHLKSPLTIQALPHALNLVTAGMPS